MALVWTAALMSDVVSASIADVFVLRHISLLVIGSGTAFSIPVFNDCVLSTLSGLTEALVFTRFGWTPLAPGIFPMMMSCTGLSIHKTLVLPLKYGVSSSTMAVGYRLTIPFVIITWVSMGFIEIIGCFGHFFKT